LQDESAGGICDRQPAGCARRGVRLRH
jgi:hypothetical protein